MPTVPDDARLRELAAHFDEREQHNREVAADYVGLSAKPHRMWLANVYRDAAATCRTVIAARALETLWQERIKKFREATPYSVWACGTEDCLKELRAILSAPAPDAREGGNDG